MHARFLRASFQNFSKLWDYIKETNTTHFWAVYGMTNTIGVIMTSAYLDKILHAYAQ